MSNESKPVDPLYSPDRPVADPTEDLYSRASVAAGISKAIASLPGGECFVIGLYGPWGDGKTSVLQFVEHNLRSAEAASCVWFNPWRVGSEGGLLVEFFHTLAAAGEIAMESRFQELVQAITKYARILRPLGPLANVAANAIAPGVTTAINGPAVVEVAGEWAGQFTGPTVEQQREVLRTELLKLPRPLVVFIDDIDRLAANEIVAMFRLIKACTDLPNITYVLAFDRDMVAQVLGNRLAEGGAAAGRKYLEKIIQIPVALPPATRRDLDRACLRGVQEILSKSSLTMRDPEILRWQGGYQSGVSRRLRTPRNVAQYLNALRFAVPLLAKEVNIVDLLLVEALRVCYPDAYEVIRTNQDVFIGVPVGDIERRHGGSPQDDLLEPVTKKLNATEAAALKHLVEWMFPRYHVSQKGFVLGPESTRQWTRDRLVCSPAYGPRYFAYAIGSTDVRDADVDAIVATANDAASSILRSLVDEQLDPLKQAMLIFKLEDRFQDLDANGFGRLAIALATLSDRFEEPFSIHDPNHSGLAAAKLTAALCRKIGDDDERQDAAINVLAESAEPWFATAFMRRADPPHASERNDRPLLGEAGLVELRTRFLSIYDAVTRSGAPMLDLQRRWRFEMLFSVARAGGRKRLHEAYVEPARGDANIAIRLLQCITQPISRSGEIIPSPGDFEQDNVDTLSSLVDVHAFAKVLSDRWLREERRKPPADWPLMAPEDRILAQFWHHYTGWAATGDATGGGRQE